MKVVLGVEMITQVEVGEIIGNKNRSVISEWLARADISGTVFNKTKYYSKEQIKDYLRYGKVETRQIVELIREIKILRGVQTMTLKEFIFKLSKETREATEALEAKEDSMEHIDYLRRIARQNGSLETLNKIIVFMIENRV